jgi:hypothetical protein
MIRDDLHLINGTCELSFPGKPYCFVINAAIDKFPGDFNTEILRKMIAKPSAKYGPVFQILSGFEEIVAPEQIHFKAFCLYLGAGRQRKEQNKGKQNQCLYFYNRHSEEYLFHLKPPLKD